jgi:peptidoglycan/LPS O-acetylase OafA/YrhL
MKLDTVRLSHIDTMRGIAILMVILVHTAQSVSNKSWLLTVVSMYGQTGVQLFFVASAFTLCQSWYNRNHEKNKILNYTIRRFFRIAPAYYLGIILYLLISILENYFTNKIIAPSEDYSPINIIANILFLHGFFPSANNNIVPGGWSIGTEVAFYAIFPILFWLLVKAEKNIYILSLIPFVSVLVSRSILFLIYIMTLNFVENNNFLYFNIVNQLPVFILGMSYFFVDRGKLLPTRFMNNKIYFIVLILFTLFSLIISKVNQPYSLTIAPFFSGISFLALFKILECNPSLNPWIVRRIGTVSYSMYLVHTIFAHKISSLISNVLSEKIGSDLTLMVLFMMSVTLTFLISTISEKFIESYFVGVGKKIINRMEVGKDLG